MSVWKTLSSVDVSKHIEKKGRLSYLSWAWAWGTLMEHYPDSTYTFPAIEYLKDDTVMVYCDLTVEGQTRSMWLPVMDNRNNSIQNPTSRQISDTKMRCLVKCVAMFGLGHYIYAGEDLPSAEAPEDNHSQNKHIDQNKIEILNGFMSSGGALGLHCYVKTLTDDEQEAFFDRFPQGQKMKSKQHYRKLIKDGGEALDEMVVELREALGTCDDVRVMEAIEGLSPYVKKALAAELTPEQLKQLKEVKDANS